MKNPAPKITELNFGFYKKKLSNSEITALLILILTEIVLIFFKQQNIETETVKIISIIIFMLIWWIPLGLGIANNFRNTYFSVFWLLICLIWVKIPSDNVMSFLPIIIYIWMNLTRIIFKHFFKYEPIFMLMSKFPHYEFNKIEKRDSNKTDFIFTLIVFLIGGILSIILSIMN